MDPRLAPAVYALFGLLVVALAVGSFSPTDDRPMTAELMESEQPSADESTVAYEALSSETQAVVAEVIRSGRTSLSTYEDYAALQELPRELVVDRDGERYVIRTTSADGDGGLFEGLLHDVLLGIGGLALGSALYVFGDPRRVVTVAVFPALTTVTVAGVNVVRAPDPSVLNWWYLISFGIVVTVPVIAGLAIRRRDLRIAGIAILSVLVAALALFQGDALSPLPHGFGLAVLSLPGVIVGWRLGDTARHVSLTTPEKSREDCA